MNESILTSIKKLLGIAEECKDFDTDIIIHINSVFPILTQLGVGPDEGFSIQDEKTTWSEYLNNDLKLNLIKQYVYLKVRLVFDPPTYGSISESFKASINELEWRISVTVDSGSDS